MQYVGKYMIGIVWFCFKPCRFGYLYAPDRRPAPPTPAMRDKPASLILGGNKNDVPIFLALRLLDLRTPV